MLNGKTVLIGVSGSIAAYKIANLVSALVQNHADVHVIMTKNATNIINPITFETLTDHKCLIDTFDRNFNYNVEHVSLAKKADICLIAPATANVIAKMAHGLADDMLTTTVLACKCKKIIAPAMNSNMYENPMVQDNIKKLQEYGFVIAEPMEGHLACGDKGIGKLIKESLLLEYILKEIQYKKDLAGKRVLITAGPTIEPIDPVRFISNHSTGKMGYALANCAMRRGADVTLISGQTALEDIPFIKTIRVTTAGEMFSAVKEAATEADIIIKAAAVADYTPVEVADDKIKKSDDEMCIRLKRTDDILKYLGDNKKTGQFLCGFSMETKNLIENSRKKLSNKNVDMVIANNLKEAGAGFGCNTNIITVITENDIKKYDIMSKEDTANIILDNILKFM